MVDSSEKRRVSKVADKYIPRESEKAAEKPLPIDIASNADHLKSYVKRIEDTGAEKKELSDIIKEIYAEAKGVGFNTKVIRMLVAKRKKDAKEQAELEALLELYEEAMK